MKFGKHIQKRQLDIPEYGASFVDYKALKKLIKKLSATPVIQPLGDKSNATETLDPQTALQANKATFFFRLDREIEKVNAFYLLKEAELKLRLTTLMDKKKTMQAHPTTSKLSSKYITLQEGFQQFSSDLNKLQQYVEINGTAFSKILKKWDKTSKSEAKETYLSRAVEVQPCFNRDVISHLSDQATSNVLDFEAWAEGERMQFTTSTTQDDTIMVDAEDDYLDSQVLLAVNGGSISVVRDWVARIGNLPGAAVRITRAFLGTAAKAPEEVLKVIAETGLVDMNYADEINQRNCLHVAAINGRSDLFRLGMAGGANVRAIDAYGRLPLHYASMQGHTDMLPELAQAAPDTIDAKDLDGFTPLIHGIAHSCLAAIDLLLSFGARVDPGSESDQIPLNLACQHESETVVRLLLARQPRILPDAEGLYPQHLVARVGKRPGLLLLLKNSGADLDQPDKLYQWTPLFHAASEGNVECLKILLNSGVSVHVKDEKGLLALYYATWEGHIECIELLSAAAKLQHFAAPKATPSIGGIAPPSRSVGPMAAEEPEGIPDLRLPPPIIPFRRYGHNFLDNKTYVIINLGNGGTEAIEFYGENKYPAARLTISSKSSDLIPRNLPLPVQDESKTISFQIDNLESFSIDFDIYPTFGSKVIARTVASSKVFTGMSSSSGNWHLELFDPRLHAIGRVNFDFQVVKPFHGIPLEITQFATYWKATNPVANSDDAAGTLVTGSSLSGSYVRLYVQLTADGVPVLYPRFKIQHQGLDMPVNALNLSQFREVASQQQSGPNTRPPPKSPEDMPLKILKQLGRDIPAAHRLLASSFATLRDALAALSPSVHVELHVLYPTRDEEVSLRLGATPNINDVVDSMLTVVFEHARNLRGAGSGEGFVRSVVFSSSHADLCTALNWKQPNYPVLLCNELSASNQDDETVVSAVAGGGAMVRTGSAGRPCVSVKEAVRIASNNNFMGLICSSQLLNLASALKNTIKVAGLVLVEDISRADSDMTTATTSTDEMAVDSTTDSVDGVLHPDGVLVFSETIDM